MITNIVDKERLNDKKKYRNGFFHLNSVVDWVSSEETTGQDYTDWFFIASVDGAGGGNLKQILNNHPDIGCTVIQPFGTLINELFNSNFKIEDNAGYHLDWIPVNNLSKEAIRKICEIWRQDHPLGNRKLFGDISCYYSAKDMQLRYKNIFPNSKHLTLVRSPAALANNRFRKTKDKDEALKYMGSILVNYIYRMKDSLYDLKIISFEHLIDKDLREEHLRGIFRYLEVDENLFEYSDDNMYHEALSSNNISLKDINTYVRRIYPAIADEIINWDEYISKFI